MSRLIFLLSLLLPTLAVAQADKDTYTVQRPPEPQSAARDTDPIRLYVEANITETLYHELAHALIDILEVPIYGPEEYAADMFAVVLMNRLHDDATVQRMAGDVARNYRTYADEVGTDRDDLALWGVHAPDLQRYYTFACLMYGANPETRGELVDIFRLPDGRADTCVDEYALTARSWGQVLEGLAQEAPGRSIVLDWYVDEDAHLTRFVGREIERLNEVMVLPERLNVSVIPCGESNAFYDPGMQEIQICTELGENLAELAR